MGLRNMERRASYEGAREMGVEIRKKSRRENSAKVSAGGGGGK